MQYLLVIKFDPNPNLTNCFQNCLPKKERIALFYLQKERFALFFNRDWATDFVKKFNSFPYLLTYFYNKSVGQFLCSENKITNCSF